MPKWAWRCRHTLKRLYVFALLLIFIKIPSRTLLIEPVSAESINVAPKIENPPQVQISQIKRYSQAYVREYVEEQTIKAGLSEVQTLWIIDKESKDGLNQIGDNGQSLGVWQLNLPSHPGLSRECALDLICGTQYSLHLLAKGGPDQWSTWRFRFKWFGTEHPPI